MPIKEFAPNEPVRPLRLALGLVAMIGVVVTLSTLLFGFTSIPANSVGVKMHFGAYDEVLNPGLAYATPYVDEIAIVPTQRLLKLEFGFGTNAATNVYQVDRDASDTETMITGDL